MIFQRPSTRAFRVAAAPALPHKGGGGQFFSLPLDGGGQGRGFLLRGLLP